MPPKGYAVACESLAAAELRADAIAIRAPNSRDAGLLR